MRTFLRIFLFLILGFATQVYGQAAEPIFLTSDEIEDYGASIVAADLDGDGKSELLVGAPRFSAGERHRTGRLVIYRGRDLMKEPTGQSLIGEGSGGLFGTSLALGDANGDGHLDLLVGAPGNDRSKGAAALILGSKGGGGLLSGGDLAQGKPSLMIRGGIELAALGTSVSLGDLDGDGVADLAVGEPMASVGSQRNCGRIHLIKGRSTIKNPIIDLGDEKTRADVVIQGREEEALGHHILIEDVD
jgi:hypothetical protein